jgi:endonuclease/exonuclease/phosphatase family metal-dependent hydrolase
MPEIFDTPPKLVTDEIKALRKVLSKSISKKTPNNLLIATWNVRAFGDLTEKWEAADGDSPKRDLQSLLCIIEIIKSFDIIAVQEVKDNIKCLRATIGMLGNDWSFLMTDVTKGSAGNDERLAFIFNTKRVKLSGLACEIVVPAEQLSNNISPDALDKQFARTPYAVSFKVKDKTLILLTLHVLYGESEDKRIPELKAIAEWMYDWAKKLNKWEHSLITLSDFNIEREDDPAYKAFVSKNLFIPEDIRTLPRTIFKELKYYDQIGWYINSNSVSQISLSYLKGGIFDFRDSVLKTIKYDLTQLSYRISDHFPLWVEFLV